MTRHALALLVTLALSGAGCGDDGHEHPGGDAGPDGAAAACAGDPRAMSFSMGMSLAGDHFAIAIEDAVPAPPARFENAWTVAISKGGAPVAGDLTLVVTPFMPDHGHGAQTPPVVTSLGGGRYDVDPIDLWMPGIWEVRFYLSDGTDEEQIVFSFCIPE